MKRSVPRLEGSARALARGELIGLRCQVVSSPDQGIVDTGGRVVDETLRTIVLRRDDGREVRLAKAACTFAFQVPGRDPVIIDGRAIEYRPWDRAKKVR